MRDSEEGLLSSVDNELLGTIGETTDSVSNEALHELARSFNERVKELNCLYGISRIVEKRETSLNEVLQGIVDLMPKSWKYPDVACTRIRVKEQQFKTANFRETTWCQSEQILVKGKRFGTLEVFYLEEKPQSDEGPFLKEERHLIHSIAVRLGDVIEYEIARKKLLSSYSREKKLRRQLQGEMRRRLEFTRNLVHELKTPLTSLLATGQLLRDETRGTRLEKLSKLVWNGASSLNERIEELHDLTRSELGRLKLCPGRFSIKDLIMGVVEESRVLLEQCDMSVDVRIEKSLPEVLVDAERFRQVLLNLVNNACRYARDGKRLDIRASCSNDKVRVEIQDYGPGISFHDQASIFEPKYGIPVREENRAGLGIGLALCRTLVELQGGKIWLESKKGKGASFAFTVPAAEPIASVETEDESVNHRRRKKRH